MYPLSKKLWHALQSKCNAIKSQPVAAACHSLTALLLRSFIISNNLMQIPIPKSRWSVTLLWCEHFHLLTTSACGQNWSCRRQMPASLHLLNTFKTWRWVGRARNRSGIRMHFIGIILYGLLVISSATKEGEAKVTQLYLDYNKNMSNTKSILLAWV